MNEIKMLPVHRTHVRAIVVRQDPRMQPHPEAPLPNEDCLFLNVFTPVNLTTTSATDTNPSASAKAIRSATASPPSTGTKTTATTTSSDGSSVAEAAPLLPVMVWIHGGGLCIGSSADPWSAGWDLIKHGNVVLVNFQYRLGALGFMVSDESTRGGLPDADFVGSWIPSAAHCQPDN